MVQRGGGFRRKTRGKLRKNVKDKGKISIRNYLQSFEKGDRVCFVAEPTIQKGMHFPRFNGRNGIVEKKVGGCYEVIVREGNMHKKVVVHPVHLRRAQ
ncbi:50S ribosomal protein L21e [Candidatus Woesearchaeota archaeon]|nr:50S ribosomal protein L21e [Candidatus Woesearchaeota archaeon]